MISFNKFIYIIMTQKLHKKLILLAFFSIGLITGNAQTTNSGTGSGGGGTNNSHFGAYSGEDDIYEYNSFFGYGSGKDVTAGNENSFFGAFAGRFNAGNQNCFFGYGAGRDNSTGGSNCFFGFLSGTTNSTGQDNCMFGRQTGYSNQGSWNVFIGNYSGYYNTGSSNTFSGYDCGTHNTSGNNNVFSGTNCGTTNTTGSYNVLSGANAGSSNVSGSNNIYIGYRAGGDNTTGNYNVMVGNDAGKQNNGSGNVFLGRAAANFTNTLSNTLYIENSNATIPLIYGDFSSDQVGINTNDIPSGYAFAVKGKIITEELKVQLYANWPDYVFSPSYSLKPLKVLEAEIKQHGHLPEIPSAQEIEANGGFELGDMNAKLLKKIEELTLYSIDLEKKVDALQSQNDQLKKDFQNQIIEIKAAIQKLK